MHYDYKCSEGHTFEIEQGMNDPKVAACPLCQSPCQRLISAPPFILKGGNWGRDGYSSSAPAKKSGGGQKDK